MKTRQKASSNTYNKYKDKYVSIKDIYNSIKSSLRVKGERGDRTMSYAEYYSIMEAFLDNTIDIVGRQQEVFKLPIKMGSIYTKKLPHKRPFHVRIDVGASKRENKTILYKVPILDDNYVKIMWDRPYKYNQYKVLPLSRFKAMIKKQT